MSGRSCEPTGQRFVNVVAIDWSGARLGGQKRIWVAEVSGGRLARLENGRTIDQVGDYLIDSAEHDPQLIIGLDFAFSFPAWFLEQCGLRSAQELWAYAVAHGEDWLDECAPPFWGRPGRKRPIPLGDEYRNAERLVFADYGFRPKSVFQVGGAGSVGTGSIRGMRLLHRLHNAGFAIWPCDAPGIPLVLEVYPRVFTGPVVKSRSQARVAYLAEQLPALDAGHRELAALSDDAFDAAVTALAMERHLDEIMSLPEIVAPEVRAEALIWYPGLCRRAQCSDTENRIGLTF